MKTENTACPDETLAVVAGRYRSGALQGCAVGCAWSASCRRTDGHPARQQKSPPCGGLVERRFTPVHRVVSPKLPPSRLISPFDFSVPFDFSLDRSVRTIARPTAKTTNISNNGTVKKATPLVDDDEKSIVVASRINNKKTSVTNTTIQDPRALMSTKKLKMLKYIDGNAFQHTIKSRIKSEARKACGINEKLCITLAPAHVAERNPQKHAVIFKVEMFCLGLELPFNGGGL